MSYQWETQNRRQVQKAMHWHRRAHQLKKQQKLATNNKNEYLTWSAVEKRKTNGYRKIEQFRLGMNRLSSDLESNIIAGVALLIHVDIQWGMIENVTHTHIVDGKTKVQNK